MTVLTVPKGNGVYYPSLGGQVCEFIEENLVFGPGDLRGEPAVLDDDKRAFIWRMYEVFPREHTLAGRRRFKRCALSLAKGLAKTELAAWIGVCELHPAAPVRCTGWRKNGEPIGGPVRDPYIPMVAYTEEQSDELCYGTMLVVIQEGPLADDFDVGLERIVRKRGDGRAVSLATSPSARDGARTSFSIMDETHWWTTDRLRKAYQTMSANLPKRYEADEWMLEVTTAPEPGAGSVAEDTMDYAKAVAENRIKDSRLFFFHREASDSHDLETEEGVRAAVIEASGTATAWRDINSIVELWRDPTTDRTFFERVWCNRLVKASLKAFDVEMWDGLKLEESPLQDRALVTLGFDGAMFHDATALVGTDIERGYQFVLGIWECPPGLADKWKVPEAEVDEAVSGAFERYDVWRMYADPMYWQGWIATWAGRYGDKRVISWSTNKYTQMTLALEAFDTAIRTGELRHDGNAVLRRHIGNAYKREVPRMRDEEGRMLWVIHKERADSPYKIDGAMAAVLSWRGRMDAVALGVTKRSVYDERGPLVYEM